MKAKAQAAERVSQASEYGYGKALAEAPDELERYLDELAEECGNFLRLLAKLRQLPVDAERAELEAQLYASLSHIEAHSRELRAWWDRWDEALPD